MLTVVAFFAILITGRYPRSLFDFNVGVLRWSWRVRLLRLGHDRHRSLPAVLPGTGHRYPADLDIPYPERLSRGEGAVQVVAAGAAASRVLAAFFGW